MIYENITEAVFLNRPNRFVADVSIPSGRKGEPDFVERVHVKNTGRCKELLIPGCKVWLDAPGTPGRKTKYDLIAVEKKGFGIINMDSQAPNKIVKEWLENQGIESIRPEYTWGNSRFDFFLEKGGDLGVKSKNSKTGKKTLIEVKGCTLEVDGIGYFPDAPTERGVKHIRELIKAVKEGYRGILLFVIQMEGIKEVRPNMETHPEFGEALEEAEKAGVEIKYMLCKVNPYSIIGTELR